MSKKMFLFYLNKKEINQKDYHIVIYIGEHVNHKDELFKIFSSQLHFPSYFGENWDAFYDCLCSLDYPNTTKILILHEDLPFKESETDRVAYIDILSDVESNLKYKDYRIDVAFQIKYRNLISNE